MPKLVLSNSEISEVLTAHLRAKMKWGADVHVHLHFIVEQRGDDATVRVEVDMPDNGEGTA